LKDVKLAKVRARPLVVKPILDLGHSCAPFRIVLHWPHTVNPIALHSLKVNKVIPVTSPYRCGIVFFSTELMLPAAL
jgi:hypothetical protein